MSADNASIAAVPHRTPNICEQQRTLTKTALKTQKFPNLAILKQQGQGIFYAIGFARLRNIFSNSLAQISGTVWFFPISSKSSISNRSSKRSNFASAEQRFSIYFSNFSVFILL